ncbi:hypothetical protein [Kocuria rhizosphaericola]|uniref:hypothetical protein n=1 Tax=Kocuria rhizosphaericola TaxID=3376284 RepID=UPI0037C079A9
MVVLLIVEAVHWVLAEGLPPAPGDLLLGRRGHGPHHGPVPREAVLAASVISPGR